MAADPADEQPRCARSHHREQMWVMGGDSDNFIDLATVEATAPRPNSWRSCAPMSRAALRAVAGVVGGRLVVAGGSDGVIYISKAYTGTGWTPLPLPHSLLCHGVRAERAALCDGGQVWQAAGTGDDRGKWAAWSVTGGLARRWVHAGVSCMRARSGSWAALWTVNHDQVSPTPTPTHGRWLLLSHFQWRRLGTRDGRWHCPPLSISGGAGLPFCPIQGRAVVGNGNSRGGTAGHVVSRSVLLG